MSELWRWIWNINNYSNLNICDWTNVFFCINCCVWLRILSVSGRCIYTLCTSKCALRRCSIFAHKWHRIEMLQNSGAFGFPMHAAVLEYQPMTWNLSFLFEFMVTVYEHFLVCFGLLLRNWTKILLPKMDNVPLDVDVESSRSPANRSL